MEKNLGFWQMDNKKTGEMKMVEENKKTEKKPGVGQEEKKKKEEKIFAPYSSA